MFKRLMRYTGILMIIVMVMMSSGCDLKPLVIPSSQVEYEQATFKPMDQTDLVADITLPTNGEGDWNLEDDTNIVTLDVSYEDISLTQLMSFLDGLEDEGWYLTGNSAYKGARCIDMSYSMETRLLELHIIGDKAASEWPEGVLSPYLAFATPPFPYGEYKSCSKENHSLGEATKLKYTDVTQLEMEEYIAQLKGIGEQQGMTTLFYMDRAFISYGYNDGEAEITVGLNDSIALVPLPPWPEIPDHLQRILPRVGAVMTVTGGEDGFFVSAEKTSLSDLHSFFSSVPKYGWTPLFEVDSIMHVESDWGIIVQSYSTATQIWTMSIYDAVAVQWGIEWPDITDQTETNPSETEQTGTDENVNTECSFMVSDGLYTEQSAMLGVLDEFGQYAEMADWNEIVSLYGNDLTTFLEGIGVKNNEDVWVMLNGKREEYGRYYFLAFIDGKPREDFLIIAQVGDEAWLGSWQDLQLRILVKVPEETMP